MLSCFRFPALINNVKIRKDNASLFCIGAFVHSENTGLKSPHALDLSFFLSHFTIYTPLVLRFSYTIQRLEVYSAAKF